MGCWQTSKDDDTFLNEGKGRLFVLVSRCLVYVVHDRGELGFVLRL